MLFDVKYHDGSIHLVESAMGRSLIFNQEGSTFICKVDYRVNDKLYFFDAYLTNGLYRVNDRCYGLDGEVSRGLKQDDYFVFKKTN